MLPATKIRTKYDFKPLFGFMISEGGVGGVKKWPVMIAEFLDGPLL